MVRREHRQLNMKLVWLVLFILYFKESQSEIRTYTSTDSRMSFLCGCASATQFNNMQIKCKDDQVIIMEHAGYRMRYGTDNNNYCDNLNYTTCKDFQSTIISLEDRIDIYKKCSLQNSCDIKIAGVQQDNERLVNYPFYCQYESSIQDISRVIDKNLDYHLFYFYGKWYSGQKINCDCSMTSSTPIRLDVSFINLKPCTGSKVNFLSETHQLFGGCSTRGVTMLTTLNYIGTDFKLEIRGMEPDVEDVIIFQVWGENMTVNCGGCTTSIDDGLSTDPDPTIIDLTTTVHRTLDSSIPAASTDQTNNLILASATSGGILAVVIIINIVGITLYCIRRRKKQQKTPDTLDSNDQQSHYDDIDLTQVTHGSTYTNITGGKNV